MQCTLCKQEIKDYHPSVHHLVIDEQHSANICKFCAEKFVEWQGNLYASLFPTKAMKRRINK